MATKFLEPGGDATFTISSISATGFWSGLGGSIATDFVHGGHIKSIKLAPNVSATLRSPSVLVQSGGRVSFYFYLNALSSATNIFSGIFTAALSRVVQIKITSAGVLQLFEATNQIGTNGATLSTGQWYRISLAYTITDTTHNRFELFVDGVSSISVTNATITNVAADNVVFCNRDTDTTLDTRFSDFYVDNSSSLTDTGNIWVTAKRPNANGTANNFGTQIGAGGSGYGTGHSPQVNERALSTTNGWSVVAVGATTEEYNIESKSTGDIDISTATIVDYLGWVSTKALAGETGQIIVNNVTSNIAITTSINMFTAIAGSSTYPAGSGTDIGMITDATATTVSLYECGIVVAYIPATATSTNVNLTTLNVG